MCASRYRDLGAVLRTAKKFDIQLRMHEMINYATQISDGAKYLTSVCFNADMLRCKSFSIDC